MNILIPDKEDSIVSNSLIPFAREYFELTEDPELVYVHQNEPVHSVWIDSTSFYRSSENLVRLDLIWCLLNDESFYFIAGYCKDRNKLFIQVKS